MTNESEQRKELINLDDDGFQLALSANLHNRGLELLDSDRKPKLRKLLFPKSLVGSVQELPRLSSRVGYSLFLGSRIFSNSTDARDAVGEIEIPSSQQCAVWLRLESSAADVLAIRGLRDSDVVELTIHDDDNFDLSDALIDALNSLGCSFSINIHQELSKDLLLRFGKLSRIAFFKAWEDGLREDWLYEAFGNREAPQMIEIKKLQWTSAGALFSKLKGVKGLCLEFQVIDESTCRNLSRMTEVEDLSLLTSDRGYDILTSSLSNLVSLEIGGRSLTDAGLQCVNHLAKTLQLLKISYAHQVVGPGLSQLASCGGLTELELVHGGLTDETIRHLSELPRLSKLRLIALEKLRGPGLQYLWKAPNLRYLGLYRQHLDVSALQFLPPMENIETVSGNGVLDLMPLYRLPKLMHLYWSREGQLDPQVFDRNRQQLGFPELFSAQS